MLIKPENCTMASVEVTPGAINVRCWVMAGPGAAALSYTMETGQMIIVLSSHDLWILGTSSCTLSAGATQPLSIPLPSRGRGTGGSMI